MLHQLLINMGKHHARKQHGTRRHAGGPLIPSLHIGTVKRDATPHQAIQIRGLNDGIAERRNRVSSLVIGENKDDIRWLGGDQGDNRREQRQEETG